MILMEALIEPARASYLFFRTETRVAAYSQSGRYLMSALQPDCGQVPRVAQCPLSAKSSVAGRRTPLLSSNSELPAGRTRVL
jgi:hypothetical protein